MKSTPETEKDNDLGIKRVKQIKNKALVKERRKQILDAALELFLEKGYNSTTIRDICRKSGINQGSLYDYVRNKDDILKMLINRMHGDDLSADERKSIGIPNSIEEYLQNLFSDAWNRNRKAILLTYRVTKALEKEDLKKLLVREANLVQRVSNNIVNFSDFKEGDKRIEVIANLIVFINAFMPLRGWNLKNLDQQFVLDTVIELVTKMIES